MTVEISGTLFDEGGNALADVACVVVAVDDLIGQSGGARVKRGVTATTSASGVLTVDLEPGRHILYVNPTASSGTTETIRRFAKLTVLTGETSMTLQAALDTDVGEITASTLQLAQEAAQDAVDAKNAAEAAAATVPSPSADAFLRGSSDGTTFNNLTAAQVRAAINVEDGADVTDTANVTAAGALMDSEVTNLAAVKAFDPADYATNAEGDLAASALQPGDAVEQTSATGSAELPAGTTAQRDGTPSAGYLRFNSTDGAFEGYNGTEWGAVSESPVKAWVNFDGTGTVAIRASGNVSSITDHGVGQYTINFTTAMPSTDYAVVASGGTGTLNIRLVSPEQTARSASGHRIYATDTAGNAQDLSVINAIFFH